MTKSTGCWRRDAQQDRQEGVQGLLLLLLGRHGQGGIVRGQREGEERGQEGHGLRQRQAILHHEAPPVCWSFCGGDSSRSKRARPAPADQPLGHKGRLR